MNVPCNPTLCILLCAALLSAGCTTAPVPVGITAPAQQPVTVTQTQAASVTIMPPADTTATPRVPVQETPVVAASPVSLAATPAWIQRTSSDDSGSDPYIDRLRFVKEYLVFDTPDCGMQSAFPAIAGDRPYGIRQPVPRLILLTDDDILSFIRANAGAYADDPNNEFHVDPNAIGGPACSGLPVNPKWNVILINATVIPRNARPGEYDIGFNVRSKGVVVEQMRMNATFVLDEPVIISRWVPLRLDEMDDFESIEMVFMRKCNKSSCPPRG